MNIRPLLLGLPLLLTGCSSMSNFSWSSLSPFNWFGSSLEVGAKGVGKLNAGTPMSESAINDGLDGILVASLIESFVTWTLVNQTWPTSTL